MSEKFKGQWSKERAWEWHNSRPWVRGFNYLPANCTTLVDMWQGYSFEESFARMQKEIPIAKELGFNSVRMPMCFEAWNEEHDAYMERLERVLALLDENGFTMNARFGNDCCVPKDEYKPIRLGKQPDTDWGYHGGRAVSPHRGERAAGYLPIDDNPELEQCYHEWIRDIITVHKNDERILFWGIWNEAGNSKRFNLSEKFIRRFFEIAREIEPVQPLTADAWLMTFNKDPVHQLSNCREIELLMLEMSDIISFHHYGNYLNMVSTIKELKERYHRPLYNTEWLHRIFDNKFDEMFPLFYLEGVGCYHYGFIESPAQYYEPWESLRGSNLPIDRWQHDILRANLRPYSHPEIELIRNVCAIADRWWEEKKK